MLAISSSLSWLIGGITELYVLAVDRDLAGEAVAARSPIARLRIGREEVGLRQRREHVRAGPAPLAWWQTEQVPVEQRLARPRSAASLRQRAGGAALRPPRSTGAQVRLALVAEVDRVDLLAGIDRLVLGAVDLEDRRARPC